MANKAVKIRVSKIVSAEMRALLEEDADGIANEVENGASECLIFEDEKGIAGECIIRVDQFAGYRELTIVGAIARRPNATRKFMPLIERIAKRNNCQRIRAHAKGRLLARLYEMLGFDLHSLVMIKVL